MGHMLPLRPQLTISSTFVTTYSVRVEVRACARTIGGVATHAPAPSFPRMRRSSNLATAREEGDG